MTAEYVMVTFHCRGPARVAVYNLTNFIKDNMNYIICRFQALYFI